MAAVFINEIRKKVPPIPEALEKALLSYMYCNCHPTLFNQVSEAGIHRPHVSGIHGRDGDGAYSIVLAGGYEDDLVS